jgi:hypothetical protein
MKEGKGMSTAIDRWNKGEYNNTQIKVTTSRGKRKKFSDRLGKQYIYTKRKRVKRTTEVVWRKRNNCFMLRVREGQHVQFFPIENQEYYEKMTQRALEAYNRKIESHRMGH